MHAVGEIRTSQRGAEFYLAWFNRTHVCTQSGWQFSQTPDGRAIIYQDAFFWRCLEIICETMNQMIAQNLHQQTGK